MHFEKIPEDLYPGNAFPGRCSIRRGSRYNRAPKEAFPKVKDNQKYFPAFFSSYGINKVLVRNWGDGLSLPNQSHSKFAFSAS